MFLRFLKSILPTLEFLSKLTPTTIDDQIVAIIRSLVENPSSAPAVHASMKEKGIIAPTT